MDLNKKLATLREERGKVIDEQRALLETAETETRDLSKEEDGKFSELAERAASLGKQIAQVEALVEAERTVAESRMRSREAAAGGAPSAARDNEVRVRYRTLSAFGGKEDVAYRMGMWARAVVWGDQRAHGWCVDKGIDMRASSEGVYTQAGALVPDEMAQAIIDLREQYGIARQLCQVFPMGSDTLGIRRRKAGVTAYFTAEGVAPTVSDKTWDAVNLVAKKLSALSVMSKELVEDAVIDVAQDLANEMAYAFAAKEDDCWLNGDGTSTYGGIFGIRTKIIDGNHTAGAIDGATGHDTFAEIDADDLLSVIGVLPQYADKNAKWVCSKRAKALVFDALAVAAGGNNIVNMGEKPQATYLGDPIVISQQMPTAITDISDTAMLLYGDFMMGCAMGDRRGFTMQVLRERYAELGQIGVLGDERFDIVNHGLGDTSTAGPVVALIGE